jgi:hypothetical protein
VSNAQLDQEAKRRIARAVASGQAVDDPAEARAAVMLARSAQQRLRARTLPNAAMISVGATAVWLLLVALPVTISTGLHLAALLGGIGVGVLLFAVILLLGQRQIRLVKQSEARNQRQLDAWGGTDDGIS